MSNRTKLDKAVVAKLAAEGLTIHSEWGKIDKVLSTVVSPKICKDAVIKMRKAEADEDKVDPRWVVTESIPGYMPDNEPEMFHLKVEAEGYALELKRELQEIGYRVRGTKREGYYAERDKNDLGRTISIEPFVE